MGDKPKLAPIRTPALRCFRAEEPALDDLSDLLVPVARRALPRLALAAGLLMVISGVLFLAERSSAEPVNEFASLILGAEDTAGDEILQAILPETP